MLEFNVPTSYLYSLLFLYDTALSLKLKSCKQFFIILRPNREIFVKLDFVAISFRDLLFGYGSGSRICGDRTLIGLNHMESSS